MSIATTCFDILAYQDSMVESGNFRQKFIKIDQNYTLTGCSVVLDLNLAMQNANILMKKMKKIIRRTTATVRQTAVTRQKANRYKFRSQSFPYFGSYIVYIQQEPMKNQHSMKQLISDADLEELSVKACRKTVWSLESVCPLVDRLNSGFKSPIIPADKHWINVRAHVVKFERFYSSGLIPS